MQLRKLFILLFILLTKLSVSADVALPKFKSAYDTKYYFANVDSFPKYKFFVKNSINNKTYKIKQSAAFVLKSADESENNHLDVWAENKTTNQKTNIFSLSKAENEKPKEYNTVYIAITFYFDKNNQLSYKKTVMKPDCYGKKQFIPFISIDKPSGNVNMLLLLTILSFLVLLSLFIVNKMKRRNAYV